MIHVLATIRQLQATNTFFLISMIQFLENTSISTLILMTLSEKNENILRIENRPQNEKNFPRILKICVFSIKRF
jgi:hypothetical protein